MSRRENGQIAKNNNVIGQLPNKSQISKHFIRKITKLCFLCRSFPTSYFVLGFFLTRYRQILLDAVEIIIAHYLVGYMGKNNSENLPRQLRGSENYNSTCLIAYMR